MVKVGVNRKLVGAFQYQNRAASAGKSHVAEWSDDNRPYDCVRSSHLLSIVLGRRHRSQSTNMLAGTSGEGTKVLSWSYSYG